MNTNSKRIIAATGLAGVLAAGMVVGANASGVSHGGGTATVNQVTVTTDGLKCEGKYRFMHYTITNNGTTDAPVSVQTDVFTVRRAISQSWDSFTLPAGTSRSGQVWTYQGRSLERDVDLVVKVNGDLAWDGYFTPSC